MENPKASVVIRAKNEAKWLPVLLKKLEEQSEKSFEVVLVDDNSTDDTVNIFNKSVLKNKKVVTLSGQRFSYPLAANIGAEAVRSPVIIFLSAHSIPLSNEYIATTVKELGDSNIAGAYGDSFPLPDASKFEKFYYQPQSKKNKRKVVEHPHMGILGMTSAAIRKDLWMKYKFNEEVCSRGGEDSEWAIHYLKEGYKIIYSPDMLVYHSHGHHFSRFIRQYFHWVGVYSRAYIHNIRQ